MAEALADQAIALRAENLKTLANMLQMMGVDDPMDKLRNMGLKGLDGLAGAQEDKPPGAQRPRDVARLKELVRQQEFCRKQAETLEDNIKAMQAKLDSARKAEAAISREHEALHAACAPDDGRGDASSIPVPEESIALLDGITKILADGQYLGQSYCAYAQQCKEANKEPEAPELWISAAACAEVGKARDMLAHQLRGASGPGGGGKRRKMPTP